MPDKYDYLKYIAFGTMSVYTIRQLKNGKKAPIDHNQLQSHATNLIDRSIDNTNLNPLIKNQLKKKIKSTVSDEIDKMRPMKDVTPRRKK